MIKAVLELFSQSAQQADDSHTLELATAALLSEVIRADAATDERELAEYYTILKTRFSLTDSELKLLMQQGRQSAEDAIDLVQFTQVINQHYGAEERASLLDQLFRIAYSDGKLDPEEEHRIRRIADLMYVSHSRFVQAKLKAIRA